MNSFPPILAPWFEGTVDNPVPLRYAFCLADEDRQGRPCRASDPVLERPDVLSWPVPSALSDSGRNHFVRAVEGEILDVLKGWSLEMGDDGKSRLAYTAEAAAAKARLDEYFRLLWEHREEFCDQVVEA
ncbi:MAG: hypothetical protein H6827_09565, partial [Planctomycetes bacterium]|nr:hypothetical protein [Planctomycetota bacterium]